jgi:superfamily I DNA/RNA helicase
VNSFIKWDSKEILLDKSERVPRLIQGKALDVISRIYLNRLPKDYLPKNELGVIEERFNINGIDMTTGDWLILARTNSLLKTIPAYLKRKGFFFQTHQGNSMGKTLYEDILNWKKMQKGESIAEVHHQRIVENIKSKEIDFKADWYEAFNNVSISKRDYMRAMLDNGENLLKEPRIKVSTIHGAKGGEAHNVILYLNQTANTIKGAKKSQEKQDEEFRVWYVGITRTIENLFLIKSKNKLKEFKL